MLTAALCQDTRRLQHHPSRRRVKQNLGALMAATKVLVTEFDEGYLKVLDGCNAAHDVGHIKQVWLGNDEMVDMYEKRIGDANTDCSTSPAPTDVAMVCSASLFLHEFPMKRASSLATLVPRHPI